MKKGIFLFAVIICLFISNLGNSQSGESKFKMVVVNPNEKKVLPLFPSFSINEVIFIDSNMNRQLDGKEEGSIRFFIKNTGNILLQELNISLNIPDSVGGITYNKTQTVREIKIGESALVNIHVVADEKLQDGQVKFDIRISDAYSDSVKMAILIIPTKEVLKPPQFKWVAPEAESESVDFSIFKIIGVAKTRSNITGLKVYINGQVPDDKKSFDILATENLDEYRIERSITLNEGDNDIKIEVINKQGVTISGSRIINYYEPRLDQTYIESRLALVIGNADYKNSNILQNPINDAEAIASSLQDVGFTVLKYKNTDLKTMKKAMDEFGEKLKNYKVGLFYYAGHGLQVKGNNYLIPVDASLKMESDVEFDCVDAGRLLGKMEEAGASTNIVILDACRDNPFSRSWGSRSAGQKEAGLAFMNAPSGSIVAYATSPGKTASDGNGKNGIYTEAILQYIKVPSLPIEDFFKYVRIEVEKKSNRTQTPWESTSLKGNFYFKIK